MVENNAVMDEVGQKTGMVVLMYSEYQGGGEGGMSVRGAMVSCLRW